MSSKLYEHLTEPKVFDDSYVNETFEIIMEKDQEVKPFVNDFKISKEDSDSMGTYNVEDRKIVIYPENIKESPLLHNEKLQTIETIKHEIEHARNLKRLYECRSDIESMVIRLSMKDYAIKHGLAYPDMFSKADYSRLSSVGRMDENYDLNPEERIASIKAWKFVINLIKNQRTTKDLLEARIGLFYSYIRGYKSNGWYLNPPTYEFLLKMGMYHEFYLLKKVVEDTQYCFDTRLMYGLPLIDGKEYDEGILKKVLLQKSKRQ